MLSVVVGWHVYELTDSALQLGLIGLAQFVAPVLLMVPAGQIVDRYNRRLVLRCAMRLAFASSAGLMLVAAMPAPSLTAIYVLVFVNMAARTFEQPLMQALLPAMAPRPILNRAIAAHVSARHLAVLIGPSLGGVLYVFGPVFDYGVCTTLVLAAFVATLLLPDPGRPEHQPDVSLDTHSGGLPFHLALRGRSWARCCSSSRRPCSAPSAHCFRSMRAISCRRRRLGRRRAAQRARARRPDRRPHCSARFPIRRNGGVWLFAAFALTGVAAIVFGVSENLVLSIAALMLVGVGDMISTVVRQTLIQMTTPDDMRGRVFAVNSLFYGTASHLGSFRAGVLAELHRRGRLGGDRRPARLSRPSALWTWLFPALRRVDRPDEPQPIEPGGTTRRG